MAGRGLGFDSLAGYDDGYGYGFDEVTEYNTHAYSSNARLPRQPSGDSTFTHGLSSRVSSVSDLNDLPVPMPVESTDGYFGADPNQARQRGYSDGYTVSPPSRPVSQFEPFQPNRSSSTPNAYTVSPPSRPVSQFEPLRSSSTPNGYHVSPQSRPTSQFEPYRQYSSGPLELEEVDISHVGLSMTESPLHDASAFSPPPTSHSQSSDSGSRTPSTKSTMSTRTLSWNPLNPYQPVDSAAPAPPTLPTPVGRSPSTKQRWKSFRNGRSMSFRDQPITEEGGEEVELLQAASLPASYDVNTSYDPRPLNRTESAVDLSSFTYIGAQAPHDPQTLREYNALEAKGHLTGGLGSGETKPAVTFTSAQLMVASSPIERMLTRRGTRMNRKTTVKNLAQREADKRGKAIVVIEEEDVGIDIAEGFTPQSNIGIQRTPALEKIYYPTGNWKPFTMQWPYLTFLILVSATLGGCQEVLYQKANRLDQDGNSLGLLKFTHPADMKLFDFFTTKYLGAIVAVVYGVLWQLTDIEVKRLEPYYQLAKPGGASAAESINIDYTTLFDFFRPFTAFWYGHWAVTVSSLASVLAVIVIPIIQSASQELDPKRAGPDEERTIVFENAWSRASTFTLLAVSLLGLILLVLLQMRKSGLTADVKGIAGVAALATKSHILMDFKDLDTVPPKDIHDKLKFKRYILQNQSLAPEESKGKGKKHKEKTYDAYKLDNNPHPFMMRLKSCFCLQGILTLFLLLVPVLLFTPASILSEKLPWLTTAIAVGLKFLMQTLEQDMRVMEPFHVLWKRHAPPSTLTLDYAGMAFGYMPMRALLNGHYILASLGIGSILLEVLTVCVSSLGTVSGNAFLGKYEPKTLGRGQETPLSFWISLGIFIAIMFYLMGTTALVMIRRRNPFLPRQPSTIASVVAFIYQSRMLWTFIGHEQTRADGTTLVESNNQLIAKLEGLQKTYGYGWSRGRDGERHCCIDEEPLLESYTFGAQHDHRRGTMNTVEDISVF